MPRLAALLDVAQLSDIVEVVSPDTFKRYIYAGNALATVQSSDRIKVITVRDHGLRPGAARGRHRRRSSSAIRPIRRACRASSVAR